MKTLSKICDVADWFDPELIRVIEQELQEPARFHRKQWEFAMIFHTLEKLGYLHGSSTGLSMGGGNERVLYSIAKHIKKLVVTDLYEENTTWDTARTNDPTDFILSSKPFPLDNKKLEVQRMDMRHLEFGDQEFDFCYSSCAFEHIGEYQDFLQHLHEVYRVLVEGGVYVFTTEFHFGEETIQDDHNYIFSADYLRQLLKDCPLSLAVHPNVSITHHTANQPLPHNINNLLYLGEIFKEHPLNEQIPHLYLLRGKYPFTSILFILKKEPIPSQNDIRFTGFPTTKTFLNSRLTKYRKWLEHSPLKINPFSSLPNGVSRFYQDHAEFFNKDRENHQTDPTFFHSDYFWFGNGKRTFTIELTDVSHLSDEPVELLFKIHRYATMNSSEVECCIEQKVIISKTSSKALNVLLTTPVDENYCYAILGHHLKGDFKFGQIQLLTTSEDISQGTTIQNREMNHHTDVESSWI
ncbi:MAG: class I SAM-dependent methyltransferase [Calditrichaeota bacterium]|nr:MAG: class I SAM-dependent methyltransferase [Calditrichota bacterium]